LRCERNQITRLDISKCENLETIYCGENKLTFLDFSHCSWLNNVSIGGNLIDAWMNETLESLPTVSKGLIWITAPDYVDYTVSTENTCTQAQADIARQKGWTVVLDNTDDDGNMYMKVVPDDITKIHGEKNFRIDEASGLIGVPEYSWPYVKFTMLINPAVKMFDTVSINSNLVPHASGHEYQITDITYNGQMRGQSWYMTCSARDVSAKKIRRKA
jgi:hypothetical protein